MNSDDIMRLTDNPDFIPGVHNYCDRWCERCPLATRCSVYAMENAPEERRSKADADEEAFWKDIEENLQVAIELLTEMCLEEGLDPDELAAGEWEREEEYHIHEVKDNDLVKKAGQYMQTTEQWFDSAEGRFAAKNQELHEQVRLQLPNTAPGAESEKLGEMIEVIQRYSMLIPAKVRRAVGGQLRGVPDLIEDMPRDYDGSAKVALIAIDRSIAAWSRLRKHLPGDGDDILDICLQLTALRKALETAFPDARAFVRPGFDTGYLEEA